MALTLFQEQLPFSNKKTDFPISANGKYTNPVVMSFAFDFTICTNFLETVMYIRNDDVNKYYKNIVVMLCKKDTNVMTPAPFVGTINETIVNGSFIDIGTDIHNTTRVPISFSTETHIPVPSAGIIISSQYLSDAIPINDDTDDNINVRLSFGYDELSNVDWENKKPGLVIPTIGNKSMADTSYIPIRLRLLWKSASSLFTIRDYFIDVSYQVEQFIGLD